MRIARQVQPADLHLLAHPPAHLAHVRHGDQRNAFLVQLLRELPAERAAIATDAAWPPALHSTTKLKPPAETSKSARLRLSTTGGGLPLNLDAASRHGQQLRQPVRHLFLQPLTQCPIHIV